MGIRLRTILSRLLIFLVFIIAIIYVSPVLIVINSAFKRGRELMKPLYTLPESVFTGNFVEAFSIRNMGLAFLNSVSVTVISVIFIVILAAMASYTLARWNNKATSTIYVLFIMGMVIPFFVIMVPMFKILSMIGLHGKQGLVIMYVAMGMSLATFLMTGFIRSSVPKELEESMLIDGAGTVRILFSLIIPLMKSIIITVVMLDTIWVWNDFLLPSILLTGQKQMTLPPIQFALMNQFFQRWNLLFAAFTISMTPMIILFFSCQKYIVKGIVDGSLKG
jgi:ABC-type sugar transport system, permease component